jgi:hypothetical protein
MANRRQLPRDLAALVRLKHASLAKALRPLRPWDQAVALTDALEAWAPRGLQRREARQIADVLVGHSLGDWTDSAVARFAIYLIWDSKRAGGYAVPPMFASGFSLPERTVRRHREEGIAYGYDRIAREIDLERMMEVGRGESAARRWLQRHPTLHWWDAPRPRRARKDSRVFAAHAPVRADTPTRT